MNVMISINLVDVDEQRAREVIRWLKAHKGTLGTDIEAHDENGKEVKSA